MAGKLSVPLLRPVVYVIGWLLLILAVVMLIPVAADAAAGSPDWQVFAASMATTTAVGGAFVLGSSGPLPPITVRQTFLLTTLAWVVLSLFGALPFLFAGKGLGPADAFYEAVSGLTTTGGTVIVGLDTLPPGLLLWRALLNWIGGVGIIVMALLIFPYLRIGGMQLFRAESSDRSDKLYSQTKDVASAIALVYVGLTAVSAVLFALAGLPWFDAICHAMSAISTGGFSTKDASLGGFPGTAHFWVATASMIAGALPLTFYSRLGLEGRGALFDSQVKALAKILLVCTAGMSIWVIYATPLDVYTAIAHATVNVTSMVTGAGFVSTDYGRWGGFAVTAFFLFYFIGGCTGSTAGSIKVFRWQILVQAFQMQMRRMVTPHRVLVPMYNRSPVTEAVQESVVNFVILFFLTFAGLSLALATFGFDFLTATSAIAAALSNAGPGLGDIVGPAGTYASLPDAAKLLLCAGMILGRLEIFTVLVLVTPTFWKR